MPSFWHIIDDMKYNVHFRHDSRVKRGRGLRRTTLPRRGNLRRARRHLHLLLHQGPDWRPVPDSHRWRRRGRLLRHRQLRQATAPEARRQAQAQPRDGGEAGQRRTRWHPLLRSPKSQRRRRLLGCYCQRRGKSAIQVGKRMSFLHFTT